MGGTGPGHKSVEATQARLVNIQKARAARKRAPLPWRSGMESRIIEQLVWQWWLSTPNAQDPRLGTPEKGSDKCRVTSGEKRRQQVPHHHSAKPAGWVRDDNVRSSGEWTGVSGQREKEKQVPHTSGIRTVRNDSVENSGEKRRQQKSDGEWRVPLRHGTQGRLSDKQAKTNEGRRTSEEHEALRYNNAKSSGKWSAKRARNGAARPWAKLRVARFLGVSHTWVNKLVKKFEADPERMRRKMAAFGPASIDKLERAREETRWERERGRLRGPIRYRRVKVMIQGKKTRVVAATSVERGRRQAEVERDRARLRGEKNQQQIPHTAPFVRMPLSRQTGRPVRNDNAIPVAYREVPEWARGLLMPGDPGTLRPGSGSFVPQGNRTPRPAPFAFRRRR